MFAMLIKNSFGKNYSQTQIHKNKTGHEIQYSFENAKEISSCPLL
jgi:hypothetical protein